MGTNLLLNVTTKMSKEKECPVCHKVGFHKLSCPNNKEIQKRFLIDMMQADEKDGLYNKAIPTLEDDEAEEFIRKAESAEKETVDWSRQMKKMERILEKSRIANRKLKYGKGEAPKVKRSKDVEE
jgi:hypothetical protein